MKLTYDNKHDNLLLFFFFVVHCIGLIRSMEKTIAKSID